MLTVVGRGPGKRRDATEEERAAHRGGTRPGVYRQHPTPERGRLRGHRLTVEQRSVVLLFCVSRIRCRPKEIHATQKILKLRISSGPGIASRKVLNGAQSA